MPTLYLCPHQVLKATGAPETILVSSTPKHFDTVDEGEI
jgi:hypothetical protein